MKCPVFSQWNGSFRYATKPVQFIFQHFFKTGVVYEIGDCHCSFVGCDVGKWLPTFWTDITSIFRMEFLREVTVNGVILNNQSCLCHTGCVLVALQLQILANNQPDTLFHSFIYFISLHVSSVTMLIIRRWNCINTSSGMISLCK